MRCPHCHDQFYFLVHGNGAVELRPVDEEREPEPAAKSRLPPRIADQDENQGTRRVLKGRRRNRPIGGYMPFEKSRSYIGTFAFFGLLAVGSGAAYLYVNKINTIAKATPKTGGDPMRGDIDAKHTKYVKDNEKALKALQDRQAKGQSAGAKVEEGPRPAGTTGEGAKATE
jgi:hypothetical protein